MKTRQLEDTFVGYLPDVRLERVLRNALLSMIDNCSVVVNQFCKFVDLKKSVYRMLDNKRFSHKDLIKGALASCKDNKYGSHVLCLQDTSEINFTSNSGRISKTDKDIGPNYQQDHIGFFCHPMLVIEESTLNPIGFSSINLYNRAYDQPKKLERNYQATPIKNKESYRWIESVKSTKKVIGKSIHKTIIGDREADIFQELVEVPNKDTDLLIRSSVNRCLLNSDEKLFETLNNLDIEGYYTIPIKKNKKRKDRVAKMSLKYKKVSIKRPNGKVYSDLPESVELYAIEARETNETCTNDEEPLIWRLLTSHEVNSPEDAIQCLKWYANRWLIEELFRVLKTEGLNLEASQLGGGDALKKLTVMALISALKIMILKLSLKAKYTMKAAHSFSEQEIQFMSILLKKQIEGKSNKLKNPYPNKSLPWFAWGIARLSGWSGYQSQGPPGYISIRRGLEIFNNKYQGYMIAFEAFM